MAETSDKISKLAAIYATMTPDRLYGAVVKEKRGHEVAEDIRRMAMSLLRQDETKGLRNLVNRVLRR